MVLALRRRGAPDDGGFALLTVVISMFVLTLVVSVAMAYALQTQVGSRRDQDYHGAINAARSGIDDLLSRLNKDDSYWQKYPGYSANPANFDCTNLAWQRPWPSGTPCGWGPGTAVGWTSVPGSAGATYHYDLDLSNSRAGGVVLVTATGKVRGVRRSVQSVLRHDGFGEFLYLTDYETIDPANEAVYGFNNTTAQTKCAKHYWAGRDTAYCYDINFVGGDTVNGPLHSNDALLMYGNPGTNFKGPVTTNWNACQGVTAPAQWPNCYRKNGTPAPTFQQGIAWRGYYTIPTSVASLRQYVDSTKTSSPGCLYTGPTRIVLNSNGTMKVWSNWSKTLNPGCGNPAAAWPQTVNVPNNNLIFVQDVPSGQTSPAPVFTGCAVGAIGDSLPVNKDYNNTLRESQCNLGTAYVEGTLQGKLTITADNNIIITDDLRYAGGANGIDALGLIASNSVKIYHPVECKALYAPTNYCYKGTEIKRPKGTDFENPILYAAILTLSHSFSVQSYQLGRQLGALSMYGSFAQRYRGPVGSFGGAAGDTGYLKNYTYDTRLKYAPPPFFLNPVASAWGSKTFGEIRAAY